MDVNDFALSVTEIKKHFSEQQDNDKNGRFRSWEHCYKCFYDVIKNDKKDVDVDYLSLHLAFYLASWGMYRGSSVLLQKDYKVHTKVVEEILKPEYKSLLGLECKNVGNNWGNIKELTKFMKDYYKGNKISPTDTLITKILMGTLGCVPAYDRFFIAGIKALGIAKGKFDDDGESLKSLAEFYRNNSDKFEKEREAFKIDEKNTISANEVIGYGVLENRVRSFPKKESILD